MCQYTIRRNYWVLKRFHKAEKALHKYFGYVEDWVVFPIDIQTGMPWEIIGSEDKGSVRFADTLEGLVDEDGGNYYQNEIYTQRFLTKWVYRGKKLTMIIVDTHVDGNKFLQIFSNKLERCNIIPDKEKVMQQAVLAKKPFNYENVRDKRMADNTGPEFGNKKYPEITNPWEQLDLNPGEIFLCAGVLINLEQQVAMLSRDARLECVEPFDGAILTEELIVFVLNEVVHMFAMTMPIIEGETIETLSLHLGPIELSLEILDILDMLFVAYPGYELEPAMKACQEFCKYAGTIAYMSITPAIWAPAEGRAVTDIHSISPTGLVAVKVYDIVEE